MTSQLETIENRTIETSPLLELLTCEGVRLESGPISWKKAILFASEQLLNDGYVHRSYVEKAISNVEEYGSYIVVNQGIALAHAGSDDGVEKDGISLLICPEGIRFDDIDEPVHLMFFFSQTKDGEAYLGLFQEIIRLGNSQLDLSSIRFAQSPAEAYQRIVEVLTDYRDVAS
ncbi:PTS sugar transporter subunit IIA [Olsenella massiliensis]|uniref:PTS sugar transporter subunit IIA n=1 Tax=Olsenella massiliensis TaxID=1622075 RepID=UPI00071CCC55|nr:PTS sugar transporter subunit IIA [Olsenella massiliensis]